MTIILENKNLVKHIQTTYKKKYPTFKVFKRSTLIREFVLPKIRPGFYSIVEEPLSSGLYLEEKDYLKVGSKLKEELVISAGSYEVLDSAFSSLLSSYGLELKKEKVILLRSCLK